MSLLDKICKEMGVGVGRKWLGNDNSLYSIDAKGRLMRHEGDRLASFDSIERVLTGELKPAWKPQQGDKYYIPYIDAIEEERYNFMYWDDEYADSWYRHNNLIFKTEEQAIEATNKMLTLFKNEVKEW